MDEEIPDLRAWQAAYAAFCKCAGGDVNVPLQYTIAWSAAMESVMAYVREMNSREKEP